MEALIPFNEEHLETASSFGVEVGEDRVRGKEWGYLQKRGWWSRFLSVDCCGWVVILGSASVEIC